MTELGPADFADACLEINFNKPTSPKRPTAAWGNATSPARTACPASSSRPDSSASLTFEPDNGAYSDKPAPIRAPCLAVLFRRYPFLASTCASFVASNAACAISVWSGVACFLETATKESLMRFLAAWRLLCFRVSLPRSMATLPTPAPEIVEITLGTSWPVPDVTCSKNPPTVGSSTNSPKVCIPSIGIAANSSWIRAFSIDVATPSLSPRSASIPAPI